MSGHLQEKHLRALEDLDFAARDLPAYDDQLSDRVAELLQVVGDAVKRNEASRPSAIAGLDPRERIAWTVLTTTQLGHRSRDPRPLLERAARELCNFQSQAQRFAWRDLLVVALPPDARSRVAASFMALYRHLPPIEVK